MSELPKRFTWAASQIAACFDLPRSTVKDFLSNRTNKAQFLELLSPGGPQRLAVFYQSNSVGGPVELFFGDPQTFAVQSDTKCCYFLRNCDASTVVDPEVLNNNDLTAGILADRAWEELHRSLTVC